MSSQSGKSLAAGDGVPVWAHYRPAERPGATCGTCDYFTAGRCEMFNNAPVNPGFTCDEWEGHVEKDHDPSYNPGIEESRRDNTVIPAMVNLVEALEPTNAYPEFARLVSKSKMRASRLVFEKAQANYAEVNLRVNGMSRTPDGLLSYRMVTKDGHYVGRTNPSKIRAKKGDVLKVQANDFLQSANGDIHWSNPNVVSVYTDAPHSWRELTALAGVSTMKETADGPAGDIPAAGDQGNAGQALSQRSGDIGAMAAAEGPTMSDVHVNVPLKNVSLFYGNRKLRYQVHKADAMKQLVYGIVLEPNMLDSQDDFMLPHHVEKAAHTYLKKAIRGMSSVVKLQHRQVGFKKSKPSIVPVESFIAPVDFSYDGKEMIKAGSWVMCMHVEDPALWQDFLDGKYTGFSIGGTGIRRSMSSNSPDLTGGDMAPYLPPLTYGS